ncbi:MAG: 50S ribosomal protein L19e [Candidatus Pacearchaeota archaeon]|nr:50S ribosomal protein L19e [Candidatus Pacearchaeota archaeon]
MNLSKKKKLAKRTLNVGEDRIVFLESRLEEIKDAITKQDIRDLVKSGAIIVKEIKGRKTVQRTKSRSTGNIRKKARKKKREYIILTRKLRGYLKGLKAEGKILGEHVTDMRKKIRNREFRSRAHLKEHIGGIQK